MGLKTHLLRRVHKWASALAQSLREGPFRTSEKELQLPSAGYLGEGVMRLILKTSGHCANCIWLFPWEESITARKKSVAGMSLTGTASRQKPAGKIKFRLPVLCFNSSLIQSWLENRNAATASKSRVKNGFMVRKETYWQVCYLYLKRKVRYICVIYTI